jgi:hypothetical protein
MRHLTVVVFLSLAATSAAQNRDDWQSLSQLKMGDKVASRSKAGGPSQRHYMTGPQNN